MMTGLVIPHASGARVVVNALALSDVSSAPSDERLALRRSATERDGDRRRIGGIAWAGRVATAVETRSTACDRVWRVHGAGVGGSSARLWRAAFAVAQAVRRVSAETWRPLMAADSALVLDTPFTRPTFTPVAIPPPPPSMELVSIKPKRAFARRDVFTPAWLPMCASKDLKRGAAKPRVVDIGVMKIVLWRGDDGAVHAMESRCPHMGADLSHGRVVEGELRCAMHHWRFRGDDGACTHSSSSTPVRRCATAFPVVERYGVVFVYPARTPAIPFPAAEGQLPGGESERNYRVVVLGEAKLTCHWHLPTANGLDPIHFEGLHGFESLSPWHHDVDEANGQVDLHLDHRPKSAMLRVLLGDLKSRFSTIGPSIAWVSAKAPVQMHGFFATRPHADGGCISRVVLFLPREKPLATLRVLAHVVRLLWQDGVMLNSMHDFRPGYVDTDAPLRAHTKMVDSWPRG